MSYEDFKKEMLEDPEVRAAYENPSMAMAVARAVVVRRKELGLNQMELAEAMKTSQTQVWRIESGQYNPTLKTVQKLEDAHGIQLRYVSFEDSVDSKDEHADSQQSEGYRDLIDFWWNSGFLKVDEETFWSILDLEEVEVGKIVAFGRSVGAAGIEGFSLELASSHSSDKLHEQSGVITSKGTLSAAL